MSTQHTPGPWRVTAQYDGQPEVCVFAGVGDDSAPVAKAHLPTMLGAAINKQQAEANAHLIAAAPDLLAALQVAQAVCGELLQSGDGIHVNARRMINAAIAKAKGQP